MATMDRSNSSGTYVAGHWLSHFPHDLVWDVKSPDWEHNQRQTRRRPTWAWTSIDTKVNTYYRSLYYFPRSTVELVNVTARLRDKSAPFGDVEDATLTIKGRMVVAECRVTGKYFPFDVKLHTKLTGQSFGRACLDAMTGPEDKDYIQDVIVLLTETSEYESTTTEAVGLIVFEESGSDGRRRFSRIGAWSAWGSIREHEGDESVDVQRLFEQAEMETFDLV